LTLRLNSDFLIRAGKKSEIPELDLHVDCNTIAAYKR